MVALAHVSEVAFQTISPFVGAIVARSIVQVAVNTCGVDLDHANSQQLVCLVDSLDKGIRAFLADTHRAEECVAALRAAMVSHTGLPSLATKSAAAASPFARTAPAAPAAPAPAAAPVPATPNPGAVPSLFARAATANAQAAAGTSVSTRRVEILQEFDIVTARGETKDICAKMGFPALDQVKIATVVSELARNIVQYAGTGYIELTQLTVPRAGIEIVSVDRGPGIPNIDHVLSGDYDSNTGMGVGLVGTKRLMDEFTIDTGPTGTRITARRYVR